MRIAILAAAAMLVLFGCHKNDRADAALLEKTLTDLQADATAAASLENEIVSRARPWCNAMTAAGAGHDAELEANTTTAADLARQAQTVYGRWETIRNTLVAQRLRSEYPRNLRARVTAELAKHQTALQELRAALDDTAAQLKASTRDRAYTGDTVPPVVTKLDHILGQYDPPADDIATALSEIRARHGERTP